MKNMLDKQNRVVTITSTAAFKTPAKRSVGPKVKGKTARLPITDGYVQVLVPYTKQGLANRKPGNLAVSHLVVMKRSNLRKAS